MDGAFGADINALQAPRALIEADPTHYELARVYFLELPGTDLGTNAQYMGWANEEALATRQRVVALFVIYGDSWKHVSSLSACFLPNSGQGGKAGPLHHADGILGALSGTEPAAEALERVDISLVLCGGEAEGFELATVNTLCATVAKFSIDLGHVVALP